MTYATLKRKVANFLGQTNDATAVTLRDNAIKDAYNQICQDYKFSWLLKKTTGSLSSGAFNLASDYNPSLGIETAYTAVTGTANDYLYYRVGIRDLDAYSTTDYVYYIAYDSDNSVYVFNSNQDTGTVTYFYYRIPADLSGGTDVCIVPDPEAVVYLAVSKYWQATERDDANADRFYNRYLERLNRMIANDKRNNTTRRPLRSLLDIDTQETSTLATRR